MPEEGTGKERKGTERTTRDRVRAGEADRSDELAVAVVLHQRDRQLRQGAVLQRENVRDGRHLRLKPLGLRGGRRRQTR